MEVLLYLTLSFLLGVGVATYRNVFPGLAVRAEAAFADAGGDKGQKGKGEPGGIFFPPGTTDTEPVAPPPGEPPF
jgi:hypothetical protein